LLPGMRALQLLLLLDSPDVIESLEVASPFPEMLSPR
jgi:hypothetical protein